MASEYSNLKIQLMGTGDNATTWGNITNVNIGPALGAAIASSVSIAFTSGDQTLTWTDTNGPQDARNLRLNLTGTGGFNLIVPVVTNGKPYIINNATDGTITVKHPTGTGIAVPTGKTMWVYADGTNVVDAVTHLSSLTLGTALPIASGGTGGNTAVDARTALGAAASGTNTDITVMNPASGLQVGSPTGGAKGAGTVNATGLFVNGTAVGVGSGSVSSVSGSGGTTGLTLTGGPITTTGTLTLGGTLAIANGGTGATTGSAALAALGGVTTSGSGATGTWGISISGNAVTATTATTANALNSSNSYSMVNLTASGSITASGNVTAYSDAKLKTDMVQIHDALDKVGSLTGYTYTRIDTGNRETGLIAQDVQAVLPEAVVDNDGTLSLAYGNLVGLLVEAIKELRAEVDELRGSK